MTTTERDPLEALPVRVEGVEVQDPIITLFGLGWSLTIQCPSEGRVGRFVLSWEDDETDAWTSAFAGQSLVGVHHDGRSDVFEFSEGSLTATPDTDWDPWVLQLPGGLVVGRLR